MKFEPIKKSSMAKFVVWLENDNFKKKFDTLIRDYKAVQRESDYILDHDGQLRTHNICKLKPAYIRPRFDTYNVKVLNDLD